MSKFNIGDTIICINNKVLPKNEVGPSLIEGKQYTVRGITEDIKGNQHLDIGLESKFSYITSYETREELPDGNKIHWCHPSRFKKA